MKGWLRSKRHAKIQRRPKSTRDLLRSPDGVSFGRRKIGGPSGSDLGSLSSLSLPLAGDTIKPIAVKPATWDSLTALRDHFAAQYYWYLLQFLFWAATFGIGTWAMGSKLNEFLPSFLFLYVVSLVIFAIGQWKEAGAYNLEPPCGPCRRTHYFECFHPS